MIAHGAIREEYSMKQSAIVTNRLKTDDDYSDWKCAFEVARTSPAVPGSDICTDRVSRSDIEKIHAIVDGENDGLSWTGVFRAFDGRYVTVCSWCDYTGWG